MAGSCNAAWPRSAQWWRSISTIAAAFAGISPIWPVSPRAGDRDRRSIYVFLRRNLRYPFFEAFDRPDTNASCPNRPITTIAPQALSLLNGKLANEAARYLAQKIAHEAGLSVETRIDQAYVVCLGRKPDNTELVLATEFLGSSNVSSTGLADLALALINLNEFVIIE